MADTIVIRFHDSQVSWHPLGKTPSSLTPKGIGTLEQAAEKIRGWRLVLIAPSNDIFLTKVSVPSKNKQRLIQAIPYALENELTEEIEQLQFSIDPDTHKDTTSVAVISRQRLESWLEQLNSVDLQPLALYPDLLCLPLKNGHWTIYLDDQLALLRTDKSAGFGSEIENFPALLRMRLAEAVIQPEQLDLYIAPEFDRDRILPILQDMELNLVEVEYNGELTPFLAENLDEKHSLNLLQGEYQQVDKKAVQWRRWLPAAAFFSLLIGINIISSFIDYSHYKQQSVVINNEIHQIFRETFPEIKRIVDPKIQMEQQLRLLQKDKKGGQASFLSLMSLPAITLADTQGSQLESINYRDNQLDLKLTLKDLQSLETIQRSIEVNKDLSVEIKSANASGNKVTSHLRIKRGSI